MEKKINISVIALVGVSAISSILVIFLDTFFISYLYSQCNITGQNPYVLIAVFYLVFYSLYLCWYLIFKKFLKNTRLRNIHYKVGIFLKFCILLVIVLLKEKIVTYIIPLAIGHSLSEYMYWSNYQVNRNLVIKKQTYSKVALTETIISNILAIFVPIVFGGIFDMASFFSTALIVLILCGIMFALSFFIKTEYDELPQFSFKKMIEKMDKSLVGIKPFFYEYGLLCLTGIRQCVASLFTCLIIANFGSNLSLGMFSTILSIICIVLLPVFIKFKKVFFSKTLFITFGILGTLSILAPLISMSKATIIIFKAIFGIALITPNFTQGKFRGQISRGVGIHEYIPEHQVACEFAIVIGRLLSYTALLLVGLTSTLSSSVVIETIILLLLTSTCIASSIIAYNLEKTYTKYMKLHS